MSTVKRVLEYMQDDLTPTQYTKLKDILELNFGYKVNNYTNDELVQKYLDSRRLLGVMESSLEQYYDSIKMFFDFINHKDCTDVTLDDCRAYINNYKMTRNVSARLLVNRVGWVSPFYDWLVGEDYLAKNPWKYIGKIKIPEREKTVFSQVELNLIRDKCETVRDRVIVEILYSTGVRASELCDITVGNINFNKNEIKIIGKGDKQRTVFFSDTAKHYLKLYLDGRKNLTNDSWLFVSAKRGCKMHNRTLEVLLNRIKDSLSVDISVHPHKFRRTFCTDMINKGMNINHVQKLMGHAMLSTTLSYYVYDKDVVHNAYEKFNK